MAEQLSLQKIVDITIRITACMDADALHRTFLTELAPFLAVQEIFILHSQHQHGPYQCIARGGNQQLEVFSFNQNPELQAQVGDGFVVQQQQGTGFTLSKRCKAGFFVHFYCANELSQRLRHAIDNLASIYVNQLSLLWHGMQDPLTGLMNRQAFDNKLGSLFIKQEKCIYRRRNDVMKSSAGVFAFIDIDHFKRINDTHGHIYGDEVLIAISSLMQKFFRENDLLFRYGGEEFVVVLKDVELQTAESILQRFLRVLSKHHFGAVAKVTVSIGFTELKLDSTLRKVAMQADSALYYSKENGRNQVNCYEYLKARRLSKASSDFSLERQA